MHCIFDLDGTLFDSHNQIINAVTWTRNRFGLSSLNHESVTKLIGLPAKYLFRDCPVSDNQLDKLVFEFRERLKVEIQLQNNLYPGVVDFLTQLKNNSVRLSIATTKPTELATWTIQNSPLKTLIDHVQGTDNFNPKPDPEVISRCISKTPPCKTFMFGDRKEDMLAAVATGVTGIGMAQSIHSELELIEAGAAITFENFGRYKSILSFVNSDFA